MEELCTYDCKVRVSAKGQATITIPAHLRHTIAEDLPVRVIIYRRVSNQKWLQKEDVKHGSKKV